MINGFKCLKDYQMKEFLDSIDDIIVIVSSNDEIMTSIKKDELRDFFIEFSNKYENFDENVEIYLSSEDGEKMLLLSSLDITWWATNTRRLNKLFNATASKPKETIVLPTWYMARCGIKNDKGEIEEVSHFEGSKKEVLDYMNKENMIQSIRTFFKDEIFFMLYLVVDNLANKNDMKWYTLKQLQNRGEIEV